MNARKLFKNILFRSPEDGVSLKVDSFSRCHSLW